MVRARDQRDRRNGGDAELDEGVGAAPQRRQREQQRQLDGNVVVLSVVHVARSIPLSGTEPSASALADTSLCVEVF
ncbi:hypothetical protein ACVWWO_001272 [Bradyrhizobium sp. F1.13.1]